MAADIREFIAAMKLSPRSQNNFRLSIKTLFEFAKSRGYLPKDHDEIEHVDEAKERVGKIEIYSPEQINELLNRARPELVPFLAIGAFAGLRSAEIERLEWGQVKLAKGFIEVTAKNAKTGARRLVPILPNLGQWLAPYAEKTGRVVPFDDLGFQLRELCTASNTQKAFKWLHNALRHSFISYRVAQIQNVAQVALEAGNSPQVIFSSYRELVTPSEAFAWFSVAPEQSEKVVPMVAKA